MESIYELVTNNLTESGNLPKDFNILRIVKGEDYPPPDDGADREFTDDGVRQGEFDAVVSRIPGKFTHNLFVNFRIALSVKAGILAYADKKSGVLDEKGIRKADRKISAARAVIEKYETITIADKVLSQVENLKTPKDKTADFGRYLAKTCDSVLAVKFGLAMLGFFGDKSDADLIVTLGKCEELTYFSVKALYALYRDGDELVHSLIELAKNTRGWGKVAAILELPDKIDDEEVRRWLISHGCENVLGLYILSAESAIKGNLGDFLLDSVNDKKPVSEEEGIGVCNIIEGLFQAEKIKGADSFNEVPNIGTLLSSFAYCVSTGAIPKSAGEPLVEKLYEKKYIRRK